MKESVIIIGSGIAGLASAVRLAVAGHQVSVYEANAYAGGKLTEIQINGFRFDAGPSLFTMPELVTDLFVLAGKNPQDYFDYIRVNTSGHYFYEDGTTFCAYADREKMALELKEKLNIDNPAPFFNYLDKAGKKYGLMAPIFIERSLHRFKNYLNKETLKGIANFFRLNINSSMHEVNTKAFSDKRLVQYFNRFATYNGSSPYKASGILTMIAHLEHNVGTFFPKNGMHQITQSIYQLALELGVVFHFNSPVETIITQTEHNNKKVTGIRVNDKIQTADIVISNADVYNTYHKLLANEPRPDYLLNQKKSSSALIFYWGIDTQFANLDLHNVLFSSNYKMEFTHLTDFKSVYYDPTIYINITSKYKPDDAPVGCENWFVMVNVPNNSNQHWDQIITDVRKNVVTKINRLLHTDIRKHIVCEEVLDPRSIESKTSSHLGALYGNASNNNYAAFLRHANFSKEIKGLYFCGGSVHPGGGIPLCLSSAKIVSDLIQENSL